jgi:hypothetical protein
METMAIDAAGWNKEPLTLYSPEKSFVSNVGR